MNKFSWLEGRYPETRQGDTFCWMKRSAKQPNRVSQTIKALEPGRLYSIKLISADLQHLDRAEKLPLSITVSDAEILPGHSFQFVYPSSYSHEVPPYTKDHPAHFNFHRLVFRTNSTTADLAITDWASPTERGGPEGQETVFNFVEVQPFVD